MQLIFYHSEFKRKQFRELEEVMIVDEGQRQFTPSGPSGRLKHLYPGT
jgi:hypothetical protein